jgi:hypothetical protein
VAIRTVEVICMPCSKCEGLEKKIRGIITEISIQNKMKIAFEFKSTQNLKDIAQYSVNASQAPLIIINGQLEFSGRFDMILLKKRLTSIHVTG